MGLHVIWQLRFLVTVVCSGESQNTTLECITPKFYRNCVFVLYHFYADQFICPLYTRSGTCWPRQCCPLVNDFEYTLDGTDRGAYADGWTSRHQTDACRLSARCSQHSKHNCSRWDTPLPYNRQHLISDFHVPVKRENYHNCSILCMTVVHNDKLTCEQFLNLNVSNNSSSSSSSSSNQEIGW